MKLRTIAVLTRLPLEKFSLGYDSDFPYKSIIKFQHTWLFISTCNSNFRLVTIVVLTCIKTLELQNSVIFPPR